jgi:hypothetical protein
MAADANSLPRNNAWFVVAPHASQHLWKSIGKADSEMHCQWPKILVHPTFVWADSSLGEFQR